MNEQTASDANLSGAAGAMKPFRCPNGLLVWNAPQSGPETRFIYQEIFERRCYEQHGVTIADGDVVVDVGANVGLFTLSLLERFQHLKAVCIEPVPVTAACLSRNLAQAPRGSRHDTTVLQTAIGSTPGEVTISYFPQAPGNATTDLAEKRREWARVADETTFSRLWHQDKRLAVLFLPVFPWRRLFFRRFIAPVLDKAVKVHCPVATLSDIIRRQQLTRIDLLKIDVEGAELDVLNGIEEAHWPIIQQLVAEVAPRHKSALAPLTHDLRARGFTNVTVASARGGAPVLADAAACTLYAHRGRQQR